VGLPKTLARVLPGRAAAILLPIALLAWPGAQQAMAHAGLVRADPPPGATLTTPPKEIRLTFSEQPEPSLSEIHVLDSGGAAYQGGRVGPSGGSPLSLRVPVRPLGRGTYTVSWRVVSADDGHATAGTYAFGVGISPKGGAAVTTTTTPAGSWLEAVARWTFLIGLVALLGATVAAVARFGGSSGSDLALAAGGWVASLAGLALLAEAQRRTADSSFAALLDTSVGRALIWRAVALIAAGVALLVAWRLPQIRRGALLAAALAALGAVVVHVGAGHAAAGTWPPVLTVSAQVAHFAAAGVWFGGLAALLLGIRGEASAVKTAAVRRFAVVAAATLIIVVVTGTVRAIDELSSVGQLVSSGYGRAVLAKIVLFLIIAGLAVRNRRLSVPGADRDLGPLRRGSTVELVLAVAALAAAALLGTLAPPVAGQPQGPAGLSASGSDFGTSVRVQLTTASARPGPNSFNARVEDYDTGEPVQTPGVTLRFTPLDDPGINPSSLTLRPARDGAYVGSGANLAFDGRWGVTALIGRGGELTEVPMMLDLAGPKYFVSVERIPGQPPKYTMQIGGIGYIRIEPDPERPGPSRVFVTCYTAFQNISRVDELVLTAADGDGPTRQQPVHRLGVGRFVADVDLAAGPFKIVVVARTSDGTRLLGAFDLQIPGR
jgi:copper transport protein